MSKEERKELERRLRDHYSRVTSWLIPLPWLEDRVYPSEDYFVEPNLSERTRDGKKDKTVDISLEAIFSHSHYSDIPPKRILVRGEAGYGKTTICIHLAQKWAKNTDTFLSSFKYLLLFRLRDLENSETIEKALTLELSKFLNVELDENGLAELIKNISGSLLIILDGYDECAYEKTLSVKKLLATSSSNNSFRDSTILLTSRFPPKKTMFQFFCKHIVIEGLSKSRRDIFLTNYFGNESEKKVSYIKESFCCLYQAKDLSPLMLYLLCFVLEESCLSDQKYQFSSYSELLDEVVFLLSKRCCERDFFRGLGVGQMKRQFYLIGKIFYLSLKRDVHVVQESTLDEINGIDMSFVLKCGILIKRAHGYEALHKSFMEHLSIKYCQASIEECQKEEDVFQFLTLLELPLISKPTLHVKKYCFYLSYEIISGIYFRLRVSRRIFGCSNYDNVSLFTCQFMDAEEYFNKQSQFDEYSCNRMDMVWTSNFGNNSCSLVQVLQSEGQVEFILGLTSRIQLLLSLLSETTDIASARLNILDTGKYSEIYRLNFAQKMKEVTMLTEVKYSIDKELWQVFNQKLSFMIQDILGCRNRFPSEMNDLTFSEYVYAIMTSLATNRFGTDVVFEIQGPDEQFRYLCKYENSTQQFTYLLQRRLGERSNGVVDDNNFISHHLDNLSDIYFMESPSEAYLLRKRPTFLRFHTESTPGYFQLHVKLFDTLDPDIVNSLCNDFNLTDIFSPRPLLELFTENYLKSDKRYLCLFITCYNLDFKRKKKRKHFL